MNLIKRWRTSRRNKEAAEFLKWVRENRFIFWYTNNQDGFWQKRKTYPSSQPVSMTETFTEEQLYDLFLLKSKGCIK